MYLVSQGQFDLFRRCLHTGVSWVRLDLDLRADDVFLIMLRCIGLKTA